MDMAEVVDEFRNGVFVEMVIKHDATTDANVGVDILQPTTQLRGRSRSCKH
jgi:hypothetical protein